MTLTALSIISRGWYFGLVDMDDDLDDDHVVFAHVNDAHLEHGHSVAYLAQPGWIKDSIFAGMETK